MNTVIAFTPSELIGTVLAVCAGIVTLSGATAAIIKAIQTMQKPERDQDERISSLEERVDRHDDLLDKDKNRLEAIEDGNRATQRALLALLDHGIDGNNIEQMQNAKTELTDFLIKR